MPGLPAVPRDPGRLSVLKTFSRKYVYRHLELTHRDLLEKVERFEPAERTKPGLTGKQRQQVLRCYEDSDRHTDVRQRGGTAVRG